MINFLDVDKVRGSVDFRGWGRIVDGVVRGGMCERRAGFTIPLRTRNSNHY